MHAVTGLPTAYKMPLNLRRCCWQLMLTTEYQDCTQGGPGKRAPPPRLPARTGEGAGDAR